MSDANLHDHAQQAHYREVFATLYQNLGIDAAQTTFPDFQGRPQYLLDGRYKPLPELA